MLVLVACTSAAKPPAPISEVPIALAPFVGQFRGTLEIHGGKSSQAVPMALEVAPLPGTTDQLRWLLRYGTGADADVRDYRLVIDDAAAGRCHIDEQNGIELAALLSGSELISVFTVAGQTLVVSYRATDAGIEFALQAFDAKDGVATGQGVTSFPKIAHQRALLRRTDGAGH